MEKLKRAGSRDPEPATERDDARLPEQWKCGTGLCSKRCTARGMKRRTTQQAASQLRRLPTTVGGAPKYLESLHQLLFRFGSRK